MNFTCGYKRPQYPWRVVDSMDEAFWDYIGENYLFPNVLDNAIRKALGKPRLRNIHMFYCGDKDEEMRKMFGYPEPY